MIKGSSLSAVLLVIVCIVAAVQAFRLDEAASDFGRNILDRKFQNWLVGKRGLGQGSSWSFGDPLDDRHRYFNWKDYFASAIHNHKRQLAFGPRTFGNFRSYFTDGLQDWRSTFRSMPPIKRSAAGLLDEDELQALF